MTDPASMELRCPHRRYQAARCLLRLQEVCDNGDPDRCPERGRAVRELAEALLGLDVDLKHVAGEE